MFVQILPLALSLVLSAEAGSLPPAGSATTSGVVDVPLLAGPGVEDPHFYVEATVGDEVLLLRLETGHNRVVLTEAAAGRIGAKVSKGKEKKSRVDTITLGGVTLSDVRVTVDSAGDSDGIPVDGAFSPAAFPDLSWAFLPSAGVLRLVPAAEGAALVSAVGGTKVAAADVSALKERKVKVGTEREAVNTALVGVPVTYGSVTVPTAWHLGPTEHGTSVCREFDVAPIYTMKNAEKPSTPLPAAPGVMVGDVRQEWRTAQVGDTRIDVSVARAGCGPAWFVADVTTGVAGPDLTGRFDLAVDAAGNTAALAPAAAVKRGDSAAALEGRLKKAVDTAGADAADAEAKAEARRGALGPYADFLHARGRFEDELPLRKELAEAEPDACAPWTTYGEVLLTTGHAAEAADALVRADGLYAPWAKLSLVDREDLAARFAKSEKDGGAWEGTRPQSHACHVTPGLLAAARLATNDTAAVAALYPARLDLDPGLPIVAGIAALRARKMDEAQAAFRQAERLDGAAPDSDARLGLFLAYRSTNIEHARAQLEATRFQYQGRTDPIALELYATSLRSTGGAVAALKAASEANPGDAALLTQLGVEQSLTGDSAGATRSWAAAGALLDAQLAAGGGGRVLAEQAWLLSVSGPLDEARKVAAEATRLAPDSGLAWVTLSRTEEGEMAAAHLRRGQLVWARNPVYALLLP